MGNLMRGIGQIGATVQRDCGRNTNIDTRTISMTRVTMRGRTSIKIIVTTKVVATNTKS